MIPERKVLSRIEDLEQCGRRIAAKIHAKLVYFIKHHHRIIYVCPAQRLDNAAGHRADISASMSAKLGFIAHAAQRHALEFAAHRSGDRLSEAGLADAWRANEAEYWCFGFWVELDHRKMLEDSLFDVFQIVVIFIEHGLGVIEIQTLFGRFPPRQIENPLEICSDHVIIRRSRSRRLSSRSASVRTSSGRSAFSILSRISCASACSGSVSPSSFWICFICSRKM